MKILYILFISFFLSFYGSLNCSGHDYRAWHLLRTLKHVEDKDYTLFGHQDDLLYGYTFKSVKGSTDFSRSDIRSICEDYPAVLGLELGRTEVANINLDNQYVENIINAAIQHYERGGIVTISWHADNPITKRDAWDLSEPKTVSLILNDAAAKEEYLKRLNKIADIFSEMKDSQGHNIPIIFRPFHEMNHGFWWGSKNTTQEDFISLWKMTYNYLVRTRKLRNLIWAYSPYSACSLDEYSRYYPGDKYVDIICFELYQGVNQRDLFIKKMHEGIQCATDFAKAHKKIVAVSETGLKSVTEADWWTNALLQAIDGTHIAYVLVWRNAGESKEFYAPYKGHVSEENFMTFYCDKRIKLLKEFNKIYHK